MFNDISFGTKDNTTEYLENAKLVSLYSRRFGKGQWSLFGPGSEKKWYSISEDSAWGIWTTMKQKFQNISSKKMRFKLDAKVSTPRRTWSGSFLENDRKSSEPIPTNPLLVWQSMESMFCRWRRSKEKILVLDWCFRSNWLFPIFSGTFRTQSYWSFSTG